MIEPTTSRTKETRDALVRAGFDPTLSPVQVDGDRPRQAGQSPFLRVSGKCLVGADFRGLDLKFAVFDRCDLSSARFDGCNLFKAKFTECVLYNASFGGAVLVDVVFRGAMLFGVRLERAEIYGSGDQQLSDLLAREYFDSERQQLAFRGTASRQVWASALSAHEDGEWPRKFPKELRDYGAAIEEDGRCICGVCKEEVIEIHNIHSPVLWRRFQRRVKHPDDSFPRPPGDAWAEDSTGTVLRGYRHCMERMGRHYIASEARFMEKAYFTAAKWRVLQSKILGADSHGSCSRGRIILGAFPAIIAWSLLHPDDERRKHLFGRSITPHGAGPPIWLETRTRDEPPGESRSDSTLAAQGEPPGAGEESAGSGYVFGMPSSAIEFATFVGHLVLFMCFGAIALSGFSGGAASGMGRLAVISLVSLCVTIASMVWDDLWPQPDLAVLQRRGKSATRDVYRAIIEFAEHVLFGYGERPLRALAAYGTWVLLFGLMYWWYGIPFSVDGTTDLGNAPFDLAKAIYVSVVMVTTFGYGDMKPDSIETAHLVSMEIIGAGLLMVIFLASLTRKFIGR